MRRQLSWLLAAMLSTAVLAQPTVNTLPPGVGNSIDELVNTFLKSSNIPGAEVSVQRDGVTAYECGYGVINRASKVAPGPDTHFQIDSLTKAFTAYAAMRLVEDGKLDLDRPIGAYISVPNPKWKSIPVRLLLGMASGIPDGGTAQGSYRQVVTRVAKKRTSYGVGLDFQPGSKYEYSNPNYFLLGEIIAAVSPPKSYMEYVRNQILSPLGMSNTGFIPFGKGPLWATPYLKGSPTKPRNPMSGFSGGGFVATMHDLERFAIDLHNRKLLSVESYEQMFTQTVLTSGPKKGTPIVFGLGWDVAVGPKGNVSSISKNGGGYGWGSQITYFPQVGVSVVIQVNGAGPIGKLATSIAQAANGRG